MNIKIPFIVIVGLAPRLTISSSAGLDLGEEVLGVPGDDCFINPEFQGWQEANPLGVTAREVVEIDPNTGLPTGSSVWITWQGDTPATRPGLDAPFWATFAADGTATGGSQAGPMSWNEALDRVVNGPVPSDQRGRIQNADGNTVFQWRDPSADPE